MSMFNEVKQTNNAFGKIEGDFDNLKDPNHYLWESIINQVDCIEEEIGELEVAISSRNPLELRDAIGDILVFVLGVAHIGGWDVEKDMTAIYNSNMSKFIKDQDDLILSCRKYDNLGIKYDIRGMFPRKYLVSQLSQFSSEEQPKFFPQGKFLKSSSFIPPNFE